jgi:glycosyltransferase involved in cell wall biosynthesis
VATRISESSEATGNGAEPAVLSGHDIVCLAHEPWHGPWKTYQQVMSLLAETNRVLYVGPPAPLRDAARGLLSRNRRPILERVGPRLLVYHEPRFLAKPNMRRPVARQLNWISERLRLAHVRWLLRRRGFINPILWIFDPMMAHAVGTFGEQLVVYHVLDNYMEFTDPNATGLRATVSQNEERMLRRADVVVAVSDRLHQWCLQRNPNSFLVPNGVNYEMFHARAAKKEVPSDMESIPRPVIGHVGVIQSDLDLSLVWQMSFEHPEWSLVFVGPQEPGGRWPEFDALLSRPNVYYLGCKRVEDVPAYIGRCDVCIMPYHPEKPTVPDSDSIKLYEYLACGRPVVSADIPSVRRFAPLVRIANDPASFIRHIEESLTEDPHLSELRQAAAGEHSWRRRVATLSRLIVSQPSLESSTKRQRHGSFATGGARS